MKKLIGLMKMILIIIMLILKDVGVNVVFVQVDVKVIKEELVQKEFLVFLKFLVD